MSKAVIQFGYDKYVVSAEDALKIMAVITTAERFEAKWRTKEDGGTTYHVWDQDVVELKTIELLPDSLYRMAKMAGKRDDK